MTIRAKMNLESVVPQTYGGYQATFRCVYDTTIPEDMRFQKASPSGMVHMQIDNPAAIEQLTIGQAYYLDFSPVPAPTAPAQ